MPVHNWSELFYWYAHGRPVLSRGGYHTWWSGRPETNRSSEAATLAHWYTCLLFISRALICRLNQWDSIASRRKLGSLRILLDINNTLQEDTLAVPSTTILNGVEHTVVYIGVYIATSRWHYSELDCLTDNFLLKTQVWRLLTFRKIMANALNCFHTLIILLCSVNVHVIHAKSCNYR